MVTRKQALVLLLLSPFLIGESRCSKETPKQQEPQLPERINSVGFITDNHSDWDACPVTTLEFNVEGTTIALCSDLHFADGHKDQLVDWDDSERVPVYVKARLAKDESRKPKKTRIKGTEAPVYQATEIRSLVPYPQQVKTTAVSQAYFGSGTQQAERLCEGKTPLRIFRLPMYGDLRIMACGGVDTFTMRVTPKEFMLEAIEVRRDRVGRAVYGIQSLVDLEDVENH